MPKHKKYLRTNRFDIRHISSLVVLVLSTILIFSILKKFFPTQYIHDTVTAAGTLGPIVYIGLTLLVNVFTPFFAAPMIYLGYFLFGKDVVLYVAFSSLCNFFTNFWIARVLGQQVLVRFIGTRAMRTVDKLTKEQGYTMLLILRIFQGGMHDLISYAAGLTSMPFLPYITISVAGLLPGSLLWYAIALQYPRTLDFFVVSTIASIGLSAIFIGGQLLWNAVRKK